jgi:hypothetical protein
LNDRNLTAYLITSAGVSLVKKRSQGELADGQSRKKGIFLDLLLRHRGSKNTLRCTDDVRSVPAKRGSELRTWRGKEVVGKNIPARGIELIQRTKLMKSQRTAQRTPAQQHECTQIGMKLERTNHEYPKDGKATLGPTRTSSMQLASKNIEIT